MTSTLFWAIGAALAVSGVSLSGALLLLLRAEILKRALPPLVSFAAGTMLAVAFLHLLPESVREDRIREPLGLALAGLAAFFVLERFLHWQHCRGGECEAHAEAGILVLVGDSLHNFLDGLILGGTFAISIPLGIVTTLAVIAHEVPHEIGDFGVLLHSGMSPRRAIRYNLLTALTAVAGAVGGVVGSARVDSFAMGLMPAAAGGFVFVGARLLFELPHDRGLLGAALQFALFLAGVGAIWGLSLALPA